MAIKINGEIVSLKEFKKIKTKTKTNKTKTNVGRVGYYIDKPTFDLCDFTVIDEDGDILTLSTVNRRIWKEKTPFKEKRNIKELTIL